jgi:hypothetical protein
MLSSVIVRGETNRRWRRLTGPTSLIRPDRVRPIDRIIDYFGSERSRTPLLALVPTHPASRSGGQEAPAARG